MMQCKVSVVIPVYNTKKYLEECVYSVTQQTFDNLEILLVDDGSTDGSAELCDRIAAEDCRVRVIHKQNGGAATARNVGIDEAKGEYVMFLDSDDWLNINAIEVLVGHADAHMTDVIRFNYVREFEDKQLVKKNTFLKEQVYSGNECVNVCRQILGLTGSEFAHPENMNFLASCGFNMYKRELLTDAGIRFIPIQDIGSFVDGLFNFAVFFHVKRFEFVDKPFYHYRKTNETAATAGYRRNYLNRQLCLFEKLKRIIDSQGKWDFFCEAFINRMVHATMEMSFNALRNRAAFAEKYREIHSILHHPQFQNAYKSFNLKCLGLKWKTYFFFIKHSMTLPTYMMTAIILKLKNRGVL